MIFDINNIKHTISADSLSEFINKNLHKKLSFISESEDIWNEFQDRFEYEVENALWTFKAINPGYSFPSSGFKGVYFCLGDDAQSLDISGSLYYNESDWAANADFCANSGGATDVIAEIYKYLKNKEFFDSEAEEIVVLFVIYVLRILMGVLSENNLIRNAGISIGYSAGDELILGQFCEGHFFNIMKLIEGGEYE